MRHTWRDLADRGVGGARVASIDFLPPLRSGHLLDVRYPPAGTATAGRS